MAIEAPIRGNVVPDHTLNRKTPVRDFLRRSAQALENNLPYFGIGGTMPKSERAARLVKSAAIVVFVGTLGGVAVGIDHNLSQHSGDLPQGPLPQEPHGVGVFGTIDTPPSGK